MFSRVYCECATRTRGASTQEQGTVFITVSAEDISGDKNVIEAMQRT